MTVKFKVCGKTFTVKEGIVEISMFDTMKRIRGVESKAKENGWKVVYTK